MLLKQVIAGVLLLTDDALKASSKMQCVVVGKNEFREETEK
jgi:hypothetical protein